MAIIPNVQTMADRHCLKHSEVLIFLRYQDEHSVRPDEAYLSNGPATTPAAEFARVISAERRVEEGIRHTRAKPGWPIRCELGKVGIIIKRSHSLLLGSSCNRRVRGDKPHRH